MADNNNTEMFDMMAPYYLFNATGKANVYLVAQNIYPISMNKGPFILPHFSYSEIDSLKMHADVIVIPYMGEEATSPKKINWIKNHYTDSVIILSICDGAWTAAATGLYDGKPLTAHATDYEKVKKEYTKPRWVQGVTYTEDGNLFSTGGVSNATDGSLAVINKLFGRDVMLSVMKSVNYPYPELQKEHNSIALNKDAILSALNKMLFKENKKLGVLIQDSISEIELAAIFDTYHRTLPSSMHAYSFNNTSVTTQYGLILLPTDSFHTSKIDELEIMNPEVQTKLDSIKFKNTIVIPHYSVQGKYIINECLDRIETQNGSEFKNLVKLALDYN
jgi:transcriptional regulator GlxA family with amidase domain